VVTNNYRAGGGGSFPGLDGSTLVYASGAEVRKVIADYARYNIAQNEGELALDLQRNWEILLPAGATVEFRGNDSEAGKAEAALVEGLHRIDQDADGYAVYHLKAREAD
jgi:2',3'-cyclic-nucleotide 2'-phosphodiesterase/3'-nucleotidase